MSDRSSPLGAGRIRDLVRCIAYELGRALADPSPRANPHQMAAIYTDHRNSPRTDAAAGGQTGGLSNEQQYDR